MIGKIFFHLENTIPLNILQSNTQDTNQLIILLISVLIISIVSSIIAWILTKRFYAKKTFEDKLRKIKKLSIEKEYNYRLFQKAKGMEGFKESQAGIIIKQNILREQIKELINKYPFLEKQQKKEAEEIAKNIIKTYSQEKEKLIRRIWLLGIPKEKSKKIFNDVKRRLREKIKRKLRDKKEEEIIKELIEKEGFKEDKAKEMVKHCKKEENKGKEQKT